MEIDLDATKPALPPWNLTIKFRGKTRSVKSPTNEQLVKLLNVKNVPIAEGYAFVLNVFKELTGIEDEITPGEVQTFFTSLARYIGKRMKISREKRDTAVAHAAAAVQFN